MSAIQHLLTEHLDIWTAADAGPKSGRGRSAANAAKVYGISKLRELILELAVRGKLVSQDAGDEPASELLKRIQAERAKLIAEGRIKKDKQLAPITEEEKPFSLPRGWEWVRIGYIGHDWGQKTPDSNFTYIEVSAIDSQRGTISSPELVQPENAPSRARKVVKKGTVIYSTIRPYLLNIAVIEQDFSPEPIASTAFAIVHPFCSMPPRYFLCFFRSPVFVRYVESVQMGIAYPAINDGQFFSGVIPIPPIEEQHRIVAKVDELMALCDQLEAEHNNASAAHEKLVSQLLATLTQSQSAEGFSENWHRIAAYFDTLFTTEASIDALKQTLLQLAVMGKLIPQDSNDEPASELLKHIQAEKAKLIAEGKIKKDKPLAEILEEEKPFALPHGWQWIRIESFCDVQGGIQKTPLRAPKENHFPYLRVANVQRGWITVDELERYELLDSELNQWRLKAGDLLVVEGNGSATEIGRCAIWQGQVADCVFQNHLMRVRPQHLELVGFLELFLNSPTGSEEMRRLAITTSGLFNLSVGKIRNIVVAFPPEPEQHRIVAKVDELMVLCDQLKSRLSEAGQLQQKLADVLVENAVITKALPEAPEQANGESDQAIARTLLAAEVVHQLNAEARMGRVKLQKVVNLAEYIANLKEVASEPMRNAAGPHDRHFMDQVLQGMKDRQWYEEESAEGGKSYRYRPLEQAGQHRTAYEALWSPEQRRKVSDLIELMRSWKTDQCERVATLYAAWNDLLIEGQEASEAAILNEVMNRWNDSKLNYTEAQWQTELTAMKKHALLIPAGFGARTTGGTQALRLH